MCKRWLTKTVWISMIISFLWKTNIGQVSRRCRHGPLADQPNMAIVINQLRKALHQTRSFFLVFLILIAVAFTDLGEREWLIVCDVVGFVNAVCDPLRSIRQQVSSQFNAKQVTEDTTSEFPHSFEALDLPAPILRALLDDFKLDAPNRMQAKTLPLITTEPYKHLVAQARFGSGKVLSYAIAMLKRIDFELGCKPQVLVICPTLELAFEIKNVVMALSRHYDGDSPELLLPDDPASRYFNLNKHIVIGLPSTIKSLIFTKRMDVTNIKMVILEETDYLVDMEGDKLEEVTVAGDIDQILSLIRFIMIEEWPTRVEFLATRPSIHEVDLYQVLVFYSSLTDELRQFVPLILKPSKMNWLFVNEEEKSVLSTRLYKFSLDDYDNEETKFEILEEILKNAGFWEGTERQVIIYVNPRTDITKLKKKLIESDFDVVITVAEPMLLKQKKDDEKLLKFKLRKAGVLLTSDHVFTPGCFDQSKVHSVIFYDLPMVLNVPDYVLYYRLATQASKGFEDGCVYHLVSRQHEGLMLLIEKHFGRTSKQLRFFKLSKFWIYYRGLTWTKDKRFKVPRSSFLLKPFFISADESLLAVRGVLVKLNLLFNKSLYLGFQTLECAVFCITLFSSFSTFH